MGFLTGKTAIITGAGRAVLSDGRCGSIGYGIATAYAKEGANLVITGRNVKKLESAKEELERLYGIQVLILQADVNAGADNLAVVQNVVDKTMETFGRIDVLINNAQASASGVTLADHTTEQFDLYEGLLPSSERDQRFRHQFRLRRGAVRQLRTVRIRGGQGRNPGTDPCGGYRMGKGRHQRQYHLPAGMDLPVGAVPDGISGRL